MASFEFRTVSEGKKMNADFKKAIKNVIKSDKKSDIQENWSILMNSFVENTVPRMTKAQSKVRKVFWLIVMLFGFGMITWQVTDRFITYFDRPTLTTLELPMANELPFPSVTICNLNPIRNEMLRFAGSDIVNLCSSSSYEKDWSKIKGDDVVKTWSDKKLIDEYFKNKNEKTDKVDKFQILFYNLNDTLRQLVGHQLESMLLDCEYNGMKCSPINFTRFNNPTYGNCFTFNADGNLKSTNPGPRFGLRARIYLEQFEYVDSLSPSAGIKIVVHNKSSMPFPEEEGYGLSPGQQSSVALYRNDRILAKKPYGNCYSEKNGNIPNAYESIMNTTGYSQLGCVKTCLQRIIMKTCNCYFYKYPFSGEAFSDLNTFDRCSVNHTTPNGMCLQRVEQDYFNGVFNCSHDTVCPPSCHEVDYKMTISEVKWPSLVNTLNIAWDVAVTDKKIFEKFQRYTKEEKSYFLSKNVLEFQVYFQTMKYQIISTKAAYTHVDLLSDLGGQLGLWMGLSVITVFELFESIADLCRAITGKKKKTNKIQLVNEAEKKVPF